MTISKVLNIIKFIDHCIQSESTIRVTDMAKHLDITERQVFNHLKAMKKEGFPIEYNRKMHKYYYSEPGYFYFGFLNESNEN